MAVKDTISKIAKSVGEKANIGNIGEKAKKAKKFMNDFILEDVPDKNKYDSFLYKVFPKRIKQGYTIGAVAGIGAFTAAKGVYNAHNRNDIGTVSHGGLSHMTSEVVSPLTKQLQNGKYDPENIMYGSRIRNSGAEGDIVFALHNMR